MMTKKRAEAGRGHGPTALSTFQRNEQSGGVGQWPFVAQIMSQDFENIRRQRHEALFVSFAADAHLAVSELHVFQFQGQDLAGAQAVEEHQPDQCEIAIGAEALPKLGDFFGRERHDHRPILFEAEAPGDGGAKPTVAEWGSSGIAALEMHLAGGNFLPGVKAIAAAHCAQPMIHGLRGGFGILLELMTDIVDDRGLRDLGKRPMLRFEPAGEIEEVVGVDAQRTGRKLAEALTVQEGIRPVEFSSLVVTHTIRGGAGGHGRLIDHGEVHRRLQPQRSNNFLTLSRSEAASRNTVLRTGGREELERKARSGEESRPFLGEPTGRSSTW